MIRMTIIDENNSNNNNDNNYYHYYYYYYSNYDSSKIIMIFSDYCNHANKVSINAICFTDLCLFDAISII